MKSVVSIILFILVAIIYPVFAATNTQMPKKLSIQVDLNYEERNKNGSINHHSIKNTLKTSTNNHKWTAIENKSYNKSSQFVVLTKIEKANTKEVTMKFLVLNTEIKPRIISAPRISVLYGQKAQITIEEHDQKIQLTVMATAK